MPICVHDVILGCRLWIALNSGALADGNETNYLESNALYVSIQLSAHFFIVYSIQNQDERQKFYPELDHWRGQAHRHVIIVMNCSCCCDIVFV